MSPLFALRKALPLTALAVAALFVLTSVDSAEAQQDRGSKSVGNSSGKRVYRNQGVGGTSWTLSDVWGEPEMPPPPTDFGPPGFDYSASGYTLNGAPNQSPYPN